MREIIKTSTKGNKYLSNCPHFKCSLNQKGVCVSTNLKICKSIPNGFEDNSLIHVSFSKHQELVQFYINEPKKDLNHSLLTFKIFIAWSFFAYGIYSLIILLQDYTNSF